VTEELEGLLRAANLTTAQETGPGLGQGPSSSVQGLDLFAASLPPHEDLSFAQAPLPDPGVPSLLQQPTNQLIDLGIFEQLPSWDVIDQL
jgi:hypothetical protein